MLKPNLLKAAIVRAGLTQGEFAKEIGISYNTLTSRMSGETSFSIDEVDKAKSALSMDNSEIIAIFFEDISLKRETKEAKVNEQ
jgi:transcriptional regulator with XRE-family HTH domain